MENQSVTGWVASNIRRERQELGWGLAELSERVTAAGHPLSLKTLSKIETGLRGIDVEDLRALSMTLAVPVDDLLSNPALRDLLPLQQRLANYRTAVDRWVKAARLERQMANEMDFATAGLREFVKDHPHIGPALDELLDVWLGRSDHETHGWRRRRLEHVIFGDSELPTEQDGATQ
jgi:transcriptional regulator with XRE-family HTH domain